MFKVLLCFFTLFGSLQPVCAKEENESVKERIIICDDEDCWG